MSGEPTDDLRAEIGRLTREPPDGFVAARTARVKELRADGRRDLARSLAAVRRPTLPAWGVDQLAHHHPDALGALFDAAIRLRTVQAAGTAEREQVRTATLTFTAAVRELRSCAEQHLRDAGSTTAAHLDEVEATLLAAATDPEVAADVRAGALVRPVPAPGFAAFATPDGDGAAVGDVDGSPTATVDAGVDDRAESEGADDQLARARAERRARLERRRVELERQRASTAPLVDEAAAAAEAARSSARTARDELADLRTRLEELEARIASYEADESAAEERHDVAARTLARISDELSALTEDLDT